MPPKKTNKKGGRKFSAKSAPILSAVEELATPASPNAGKTKIITCGDKTFSVEWLDGQAKIVGLEGIPSNPNKNERFSCSKKVLCGANATFGMCLCDDFMPAYGNRKFGVMALGEGCKAKSIEVWLCANCQQHCGLLNEEEQRNLVPENVKFAKIPLTTGDNKTDAFLCKGSCYDFAEELSSHNHIIIRVEVPPTPEEMRDPERVEILFRVTREGVRRGSKHYACKQGDYEKVYNTLMECPNVAEVWKKTVRADGGRFFFVISVLYKDEKVISFVPHVDRHYLGKPEKRSNWTIYMKKLGDGDIGKIMRFQNRQTGWWFDIFCTHGTIVEQSKFASGIHTKDDKGILTRSPIVHAVFNATETCTITWDHGKKCDGTIRAFLENEIAAVYEIDDDQKEDGEYSDDDSEGKKPANLKDGE